MICARLTRATEWYCRKSKKANRQMRTDSALGEELADKPMAKRGGELYAKRCAECHEQDGRGTREYSRIAGQQPVYLTQSLKGYRDGTGPRLDREMVDKVKPLNDADISAIVAFVSSMK